MYIIRTLRKKLEAYGIENALELAEQLYGLGISDLLEEHKKMITYLNDICEDISQNYYLAVILKNETYESIVARYQKYINYVDKKEISLGMMSISEEKLEQYQTVFAEFSFEEEQIENLISQVISLGTIATHMDNVKNRINAFSIFELSVEARNIFICDNADLIFNDYSREMESIFDTLVEKYGKREAFDKLIQYPQIIRLGVAPFSDENSWGENLIVQQIPDLKDAKEKTYIGFDVTEGFCRLTEREQKIIRYRFGLDDNVIKSREETAKEFGITRERVQQIEQKFRGHYQRKSRYKKLREYLE